MPALLDFLDVGLLPLIRNSESRLVKVNLGGCMSPSDASVSAPVKTHGSSLKLLNLHGCKKITDKTMLAIAINCSVLWDLDISRCNVSDSGISALASAEQLNLRILSLAGCYGVTKKSLQFLGKMKDSLKGLGADSALPMVLVCLSSFGGVISFLKQDCKVNSGGV